MVVVDCDLEGERRIMKKIAIIANDSNGLYLFREDLMKALIAQGNEVYALIPYDTNIDDIKNLGVNTIDTPINRRGINPIEDIRLPHNQLCYFW